jgi:hypothetical protein
VDVLAEGDHFVTSYYALVAEEVSIFDSYVDSDLRACLLLGLITDAGVKCSQSTLKEGAEPFPVHLKQFTFNKTEDDPKSLFANWSTSHGQNRTEKRTARDGD